jgi:hypothetical protein
MATKQKKLNHKLQAWIDARRRHHLSHAQVQMARELGMNPRKLGKLDNHKQEPWKIPLRQFIEHLYFKRFGKERPDVVLSIEEQVRVAEEKKAHRRQAKLLRRQAEAADQAAPEASHLSESSSPPASTSATNAKPSGWFGK